MGPARAGQLLFRGAVQLRASDPSFGGFSGLVVSEDGRRARAVSDRGAWAVWDIELSNAWLTSAADLHLAPMKGLDGGALKPPLSDAEEAAAVEGGYLVSFEREHRLLFYPFEGGAFGAPALFPVPPGMDEFKYNAGVEAMAARDGRIVMIAEEPAPGEADLRVWIWDGAEWAGARYPYDKPFSPTGAAFAPDGDLIVLERGYFGGTRVEARVRRIASDDLQPGAELRGEMLGALDRRHAVDNFEALAVTEEDGR
ncbi:MAG: esterase-like activity of phytase family protein, partial [Pseudomonadota bacterium]